MHRPLRIDLVNQDGRHALRLTVGNDTTVLDGAGVGELIEQLAFYRAAMKPAIPGAMLPKHRYHITIDPCWYVEPSQLFDAKVMFLRHEGVGWTGFMFDDVHWRGWLGELRAAVAEIEGRDLTGGKPC